MRIPLNKLTQLISAKSEIKRGCIVDTNTLFAGAMPMDRLNEWADLVFDELHAIDMPIFTNINIRSEFMDLQRRVLVPEGLATLYERTDKAAMDVRLRMQLKSLKTSMDEAALTGKLYRFNDQQMKKYRRILVNLPGSAGVSRAQRLGRVLPKLSSPIHCERLGRGN